MSLSYTYETLFNELKTWPEDFDQDFLTELPNIMRIGETQLIRDLALQIFEDTDVAAITTGSSEVEKPGNMIAAIGLSYVVPNDPQYGTLAGEVKQLNKMHPDWVLTYSRASRPGPEGLPKYYSEEDELIWRIAPVPNFTGTMDVRMTRRPDMLDPSIPTGTSWLSCNMPDLLLWQCEMIAHKYLKNDARFMAAKRAYDLSIGDAKAEVSQLRRVGREDATVARDIQRAGGADGPPPIE